MLEPAHEVAFEVEGERISQKLHEAEMYGFARPIDALEIFADYENLPEASFFPDCAEISTACLEVLADPAPAQQPRRTSRRQRKNTATTPRGGAGRGATRRRKQRTRKRNNAPMAEAHILESDDKLLLQCESDTDTPFATACLNSSTSNVDDDSSFPEVALSQVFMPFLERTPSATASMALPVAELHRAAPPPVPAIQLELLPALPIFHFVNDAAPSFNVAEFGLPTPLGSGFEQETAFQFADIPEGTPLPLPTNDTWPALCGAPRRESQQDDFHFWDALLSPLTPIESKIARESGIVTAPIACANTNAIVPPVIASAVSAVPHPRVSAVAPPVPVAPEVRAPRYAYRSKYRCGYCGEMKLGHECNAVRQVSGTGCQTDLSITAPHRFLTVSNRSQPETGSSAEAEAVILCTTPGKQLDMPSSEQETDSESSHDPPIEVPPEDTKPRRPLSKRLVGAREQTSTAKETNRKRMKNEG